MMKYLYLMMSFLTLAGGLSAHAAPKRTYLHDDWQFCQARLKNWYPASVPGTVHTDLMENRIIEDPYYRLNERGVQWVDKEDWIYRTSFHADSALLDNSHVELVFEGLDTYADVYLNDEKLLSADNMFLRWDVDVKERLHAGENKLEIYFHSPIKVDMPKFDSLPYKYPAANDQSENGGVFDKRVSVFARKAGYHYGWDWGPRLVTSGIWRPVYLEAWSDVQLRDVYYHQREVTRKSASVDAEISVSSDMEQEAVVVVKSDAGHEFSKTVRLNRGENAVVVPLTVKNPRLWWTRELGEPHLYTFTTEVKTARATDTRSTRVGLRSLRLVRDKVEDGVTFYFELNGEPVFAKGANYIPCDVFLPRVTREIYEKTIDDAVDAHMNMLRVWGGGIYENDVFYDLCDEKGVLVWQDFMFACSLYPVEGALAENIRKEAVYNVCRLRNHPSIALWCGNNECVVAWHGWGWKNANKALGHPEWDAIMERQLTYQYYELLPEVVAQYAPETQYHPSSPWSRPDGRPEDHSGDSHYWEVWHGMAPISSYAEARSRFFSEYGFQSFPEYNSILRYAPEERDHAIESEVMMSHQRGGAFANMRINQYLEADYWPAKDFRTFLYMNHILQGDAIKAAIEAHRRDKPYCWGSLFWQHNDCWPVASWSSRDWYGRWKAQHYFARHAYRDILVSPHTADGVFRACVVSDRRSEVRGELDMKVMKMDGEVVWEKSLRVKLRPNASLEAYSSRVDDLLNGEDARKVIVALDFRCSDGTYTNIGYFVSHKELETEEAAIDYTFRKNGECYEMSFTSDKFVRGLYLSLDGNEHFEDNYFDLLPNTTRTVCVKTDLSEREFAERLSYMHLQQTR